MSWTIPPSTPWTTDGDTVWVLNVESGQAFALEAVAGCIWDQVDGARDLDDLVDRLVEEQGWVREEIHDHVAMFVAELVTRGLIRERAQ